MEEILNIDALKELLDKASDRIASTYYDTRFDRIRSLYCAMFKEEPSVISLQLEGEYLNENMANKDVGNFTNWGGGLAPVPEEDEEDETEENKYRTFKEVVYPKTMINMVNHFKDTCYIYRYMNFPIIVGNHMIIFYDSYNYDIFIFQQGNELSDEIKSLVVDKEKDKSIRIVHYVTHDNRGFDRTPVEVKKQDVNLAEIYNDDLPNDEIIKFLRGNKSGLILLNGIPGTGKTSYIRYLMYTLFKRKFLILDNSVFNFITDASFIQLLLNNKNAIIVLEDCEEMLADRVAGNNKLAALLNLSDGIIGDSLNFKFICTFNTSISNLDKAIMRKGRMKLKYEFKKLDANKVQAIAKKLGKNVPDGTELTLADLFNYGEDNGAVVKNTIGFGKNN